MRKLEELIICDEYQEPRYYPGIGTALSFTDRFIGGWLNLIPSHMIIDPCKMLGECALGRPGPHKCVRHLSTATRPADAKPSLILTATGTTGWGIKRRLFKVFCKYPLASRSSTCHVSDHAAGELVADYHSGDEMIIIGYSRGAS